MTRPLPQINELVTDDLIELHAEAICNATGGPQWDELSTRQAGIMRAEARAALAVVAPLIAAKALRDAAKELHIGVGISALRITGEHAEEIARLAILARAERFKRGES